MPLYTFTCESCGLTDDLVRSINGRDEVVACPKCTGVMLRDAVASMKPHSDAGFHKPLLSRALGILPSQIPEAQQRFPHHKFAPDGRMIIESAAEYDRVQKDLGLE